MDWHAEIGHQGEQPRLFRPTAFNFPNQSSVRCLPSAFVFLFFFLPCRIRMNSHNSSTSRHVSSVDECWRLQWRQRANSPSRCCAHVVQLVKYYAMMGGDWGWRGEGVGRLGPFCVGDSSVFHELSSWVFSSCKDFVRLLCVSITSSVSDHSLHVIPPLSTMKKKINQVVFSFRQPHHSGIVASIH